MDGIPDFFISETEQDSIDEPNKTWLDPEIVEARDTVYRLCTRQLKGMTFCMQEIGPRTGAGCRVLEVGTGTGHFTCWLAEVARPGTEIYSFDFSWPIIAKAKVNTRGLSGVTLFRANARGLLPFEDEGFDILLVRLSPLGARDIPNVQVGYKLLRAGGWYFEAGWERTRCETPPTEWALQHGFESAEQHDWQYWRTVTEQEHQAAQFELDRLLAARGQTVQKVRKEGDVREGANGTVRKMTREHLLIAHKSL